jgi:glucosamine-6-phosphate deaminase
VCKAREVVIIITGAHKALALQKCIEEGINHMWTLSSLQLHPHPMIVIDEDATLELKVKTVRVRRNMQYSRPRLLTVDQYFKSIEKVANEQGFRQMLPRIKKRDSVHEEDDLLPAPKPQRNGLKLAVPAQDVSRSASPALEPMSARISDNEANALGAADVNSELQFAPMSARVAG